jgi:uncharacterized membrane protein
MEQINYKRELIFLPLLILPLIYIADVWGQLPDRIAIHFGFDGHANGWSGKWGIFILPTANIGTYLLILFLPQIDPKRMNNENFNSMFYKIRLAIVFFLCFICFLATDAAVKGSMNKGISNWIPVGVFLFLSLMGNFMINIKPNWFIGVRTPWTLSSDSVWRKTHQVVGRLWFYGGLLCAILAYFSPSHWTVRLIMIFVIGTVVFSFVYSYWLFKKEQETKA